MTPRQMAMLDACDRYVVGLATAYDRYDRTPDGGERYCLALLDLGRTLAHDVRLADRENPTDADVVTVPAHRRPATTHRPREPRKAKP